MSIRGILAVLLCFVFLSSCGGSKETLQTNPANNRAVRSNNTGESDKEVEEHKPLRKGALRKKYAAILDTSPGNIRDYDLYRFIDSWTGVKYRSGGNEKTGVDCSGLICRLYKEVYHTDLKRSVLQQYNESRNFHKEKKFREGDLVYFKTTRDDPSHVGVYLKNGFFFHSSTNKGVTINSLDEAYWKKAYIGGGRVRKKG